MLQAELRNRSDGYGQELILRATQKCDLETMTERLIAVANHGSDSTEQDLIEIVSVEGLIVLRARVVGSHWEEKISYTPSANKDLVTMHATREGLLEIAEKLSILCRTGECSFQEISLRPSDDITITVEGLT